MNPTKAIRHARTARSALVELLQALPTDHPRRADLSTAVVALDALLSEPRPPRSPDDLPDYAAEHTTEADAVWDTLGGI